MDKVSCGPFHAAAISDDGRLFSWGDGLFGKLGHGDHATCCSPRQVTTLAEHWVISVSCGWWHSAAAAVPRSCLSPWRNSSNSSIASAASKQQQTPFAAAAALPAPVQQAPKSAAASRASSSGSLGLAGAAAGEASDAVRDVGGALFTWGGDFTWEQRGKRDHHEGCLGLGDLAGRLAPTMVKGEDDIKQVRRVANGWRSTLGLKLGS